MHRMIIFLSNRMSYFPKQKIQVKYHQFICQIINSTWNSAIAAAVTEQK